MLKWSLNMNNQVGCTVQPPAVAGIFYPGEPDKLRNDVDQFLNLARSKAVTKVPAGQKAKALIAPHAAYLYSGAIAAAAYTQIQAQAKEIRRVVIFAPAHRFAFRGLATASADCFHTPLGGIVVDQAGRQQLLNDVSSVHVLDEAFHQEHALEVQLPFLQQILGDFILLPLLVGDTSSLEVEQVMKQCWGGPETLIVVSSDLSHFHDYDTAERMDQHTSANIESLHPESITTGDACGRIPISGLLLAAKEKGLQGKIVARCNSGDTGGDRQRVVGYGAYVFI